MRNGGRERERGGGPGGKRERERRERVRETEGETKGKIYTRVNPILPPLWAATTTTTTTRYTYCCGAMATKPNELKALNAPSHTP